MQVVATYNMDVEKVLQNHGLNENGPVQCFIDNECIRLMDPYTPFRYGALQASVRFNSVIGSGKLTQATPYARYLYYGEVYGPNIPIFEDPATGKVSFGKGPEGAMLIGWYSPPNKQPTGRSLKYDQSKSPKAGSHWFERMIADHKEDIGSGAAKVAGGRFIK